MKTVGVMLALCLSFLLSSCYLLEANTLILWLNEDELEKVVDLSELEGSPLVDNTGFSYIYVFRPLDNLNKIHLIAIPDITETCETMSMHYFSLEPSNEHYAVQEVMPGFAEEFGIPLYLGIYHGDCWLLEDRELWTYHQNGFVSYDLKDEVTTMVNNNRDIHFSMMRNLYFHEDKLYFIIGLTYNPSESILYSIDFPSLDPSTLTQHYSLRQPPLSLGFIEVIKDNKMYWNYYSYAQRGEISQGLAKRGIVEIDLDTQEKRVLMEVKEQETKDNGVFIYRGLGRLNYAFGSWQGKYWMFPEIMSKDRQTFAINYHIFNTQGTFHCKLILDPELSIRRSFLKTHDDGTYYYIIKKDDFILYRWKVPFI